MPQANRLNLPTIPVKQQVENRHIWNESRSAEDADFFSLGYSGRATEEILDALMAHGIRTLVDVRQYPISQYKPDFSKGNLVRLLAERGIGYAHLPELGVPRDIRAKAIETGSRDVIWEWYDEYVIPECIGDNLHRFLNSTDHPVALMCTEIDPHECHRHRLVLALERLGLRGYDL